jgi:hypothetical protein
MPLSSDGPYVKEQLRVSALKFFKVQGERIKEILQNSIERDAEIRRVGLNHYSLRLRRAIQIFQSTSKTKYSPASSA